MHQFSRYASLLQTHISRECWNYATYCKSFLNPFRESVCKSQFKGSLEIKNTVCVLQLENMAAFVFYFPLQLLVLV